MLVLVLNAGSTSLKLELFDMPAERCLASGKVERVGKNTATVSLRARESSSPPYSRQTTVKDHRAAFATLLASLRDVADLDRLGAVGHRVVHGGERLVEPTRIDERVENVIATTAEFAPLHNPINLAVIHAGRTTLPHLPHVAVFDTAFHRTLTPDAFLYGLPYELYEQHHIRRYGFHGTSHRFVAAEAARLLARPLADLKLITCHLGGGASACAIDGGRSIDTSMGMTPLEGLLMGTRTGDLDPAIVLELQDRLGLDTQGLDAYLNRECGLKGLSGSSRDMRDLLGQAADGNERANLAIAVFCRRVKKYIGAYAAVLGGLDAVVFTAGIGENAPDVRARIVNGLEFLGLRVEEARNHASSTQPRRISPDGAGAAVLVIPTDEELQIARETYAVVAGNDGNGQ